MILVDTSVWADHFRKQDAVLAGLLTAGQVLTHPYVIGELALGNLRQAKIILPLLHRLPGIIVASDQEVLGFIAANALNGSGIGYIDAHLLASARLAAGSSVWTRDRRLGGVAERMGLASTPT